MNLKKVYDYTQGTLRYKLYYSKFSFLLRKHIVEQFEWRVLMMDKECYDRGECKICGCNTPALQFANITCEKPCYPKMMSKREWRKFNKK